jgi:FtsP/CotA-like multicopper oxidase with cupredoxin domain
MHMDGANGVTECKIPAQADKTRPLTGSQGPIAPGETRQYKFRCTQFGTSWYHSHFSAQYGDGVVGTMIINGPATANYDEDLGVLPITDWFHETAFAMNWRALHGTRGPPIPDNALINGVMKSPDGTRGSYYKLKVKKGKKYRLRIINTSIDTHWHVSLVSLLP